MRENRNRRFVATIQPIAHEKLYPIHSPLLKKQKGAFAFGDHGKSDSPGPKRR